MRNVNPNIMNALNAASNQSSIVVDAQQLLNCSVQAIVTGSAVGTLQLQVSNDPCAFGNIAQDFTPTNWSSVSGASVSVSGSGVYIIPKTDLSYRWVKVTYTFTSGTGTVSANLNALSL